MSAGKALYKRAKIWELKCLEEETDVRESLQSQFSSFQWWWGREQGNLWRLLGLLAELKEGTMHGQSSCPWLLGAFCFSRLESEICINLEHSEQKDTRQRMRKNGKISPQKPARADILALHCMCQNNTVKPHLVKQQSTIFHSLYYKQE